MPVPSEGSHKNFIQGQGGTLFFGMLSLLFAAAACYFFWQNKQNERDARTLRDQEHLIDQRMQNLQSEVDKLQSEIAQAGTLLKSSEETLKQKEHSLESVQQEKQKLASEKQPVEKEKPSYSELDKK